MTFQQSTRTRPSMPGLWSRLRDRRQAPHRKSTRFASTDPESLQRRLADSDCFCRDTAVGKLYHRRQASFREISPTDSLHVTVSEDGLVTTHVDRHSPLARRQPGGTCRYSILRVAAHNVTGMAGDLLRLAVGPRAPGGHHDGEQGLTDDVAVAETVASREQATAARAPGPRPDPLEEAAVAPELDDDAASPGGYEE